MNRHKRPKALRRIRRRDRDRLTKHFQNATPKGPCLIWPLYKDRDGYGQVKVNGRMHWAHRVAYVYHNGPLAAGLTVHHKCYCTSCVNPAHLTACPLEVHNNDHEPIPGSEDF